MKSLPRHYEWWYELITSDIDIDFISGGMNSLIQILNCQCNPVSAIKK